MSAIECPYEEKCCMKTWDGEHCTALSDTKFPDGKCHFRKENPKGENLYDKERRKRK